MVEQIYTITSETGVHARPATQLVHKAGQFTSEITLAYKGKEVNLKSIMGVMSLGIPKGSQITIKAEGPDEVQAMEALESLIKKELGE